MHRPPDQIWTVLIVEDDAESREQLAQLLVFEGFAALTARTGEDALQVLKAFPGRCLILLDLGLPGITGEAFAMAVLEFRNAASRFPIIVVSGSPDAEFASRLPLVHGVLRKPFDEKTLLSVVREHVQPVGRRAH